LLIQTSEQPELPEGTFNASAVEKRVRLSKLKIQPIIITPGLELELTSTFAVENMPIFFDINMLILGDINMTEDVGGRVSLLILNLWRTNFSLPW